MHRIVLDARSLVGQRAGVGRYTAEVARRLPALLPGIALGFHIVRVAPDFAAIDAERRSTGSAASETLRRRFVDLAKRIPFAKPAARLARVALARWAVRDDLYWAPNHALPAGVRGARNVVTIHDLSWMLHPEWHPRDRVALFSRHVPRSVHRAEVVVTVSRAIRDEVVERLGVPQQRIRVVANGVDRAIFRPRPIRESDTVLALLGIRGPFILAAGTIEPRKNLHTLLSAWARLDETRRREHELVIAGGEGWRDSPIRTALAAAGPSVRVAGRVDDEELACLYSRATALVYPSAYEGFGLPPIEALACGTLPVVADIPVMREVVGGLGLLFGMPADDGALAAALEEMLSRGPADAETRQKRSESVARYTWDESARIHAGIFSDLLDTRVQNPPGPG